MFSWGAGSNGQLGLGASSDSTKPQQVQVNFPGPVEQISCGGHHTLFMTGGRTRACGGLTGLGPLAEAGQEEQLKPQLQQLEAGLGTRIVQIATGWAHSSFVTEMGQAFTAGEGRAGQLGLGCTIVKARQPFLLADVAGRFEVRQAACGMYHTLLLAAIKADKPSDGHGQVILGCGLQRHGQLGTIPQGSRRGGLEAKQWTMRSLEGLSGLSIRQVAAGGHLSAALHSEGAGCLVWGKGVGAGAGSFKEISSDLPSNAGFAGNQQEVEPPAMTAACESRLDYQDLEFTRISLGWHHMLALDSLGCVWAWGSNRYGQCGCQRPQNTDSLATFCHKSPDHGQAQLPSSHFVPQHASAPSANAASHASQQDPVTKASCAQDALHATSAHIEHPRPSGRCIASQYVQSMPSQMDDAALAVRCQGAGNSSKDTSVVSISTAATQDIKNSSQLRHQSNNSEAGHSLQARQVTATTASLRPESDAASTADQQPAFDDQHLPTDHHQQQTHSSEMQQRTSSKHLGHESRHSEYLAPVPGLLNVPCQAVAAGSEHSLAVSKHGQVFAWGWGEHGQLGLGHQQDVCCPTQIEGMPPMKGCAAGCGFSFAFQ